MLKTLNISSFEKKKKKMDKYKINKITFTVILAVLFK